jgi:hypothetical protein
MSTTTPNMSLTKPDVGTEAGPLWATLLNACMDLIDAHDHSSGKGPKVTQAGINITGTLEVNAQAITEIARLVMHPLSAIDAVNGSMQMVNGELYFRDNSGNNVQLTASGGIRPVLAGLTLNGGIVPAVTVVNSTPYTVLSTDFILLVNTTAAARTINLPAVASGTRILFVVDHLASANTNNITIDGNGAETIDGASTSVISTARGCKLLVCDGTAWYIALQR